MTNNKMLPEISFVVPVFNEESTLPELLRRILDVFDSVEKKCELVIVDDGSTDGTLNLLCKAVAADKRVRVVALSRNHGHQLAVAAGMSKAVCTQAAFILDGDLQDPPELIDQFLEKLESGYDVVYGVRRKRKESFMLKAAYHWAYRVIRMFSNIDMPLDSGDFALISRRVLSQMVAMPERKKYLRGMRAWVGYPQCGLEYERASRFSGESKYNFRMLLNLLYEGIFSFSEVPIRLMRLMGGMSIVICAIYSIYLLVNFFFFGSVPRGFTTLVLLIFFLFGVQIVAIGIVGEYVARTLVESRNRPEFVIKEIFER